ncbi:beta-N-acetylhexosaminidase [Paenibacillus sp. HN-1]|uniref:beta-N-acetylhexosaminidase n=1 Tax=Paenibacillus TaxID=44249 RepID=UPI001CA7D18E|nr:MULTISPECIES: beta-N-acetylhexosaminidase [Paenibacillus]MBY9078193.1 beta-N-acetylhexosaminidase [Paenibacillus sp. CGMCC 1.18879]MBY9086148.1 beta-N-acetylhexosaminidase [Paenibacillus sinensis]
MRIFLQGDFSPLAAGLPRLAGRLDGIVLVETEEGAIPLVWEKREGPLEAEWDGSRGMIRYEQPHHGFRAFGLWVERMRSGGVGRELSQLSFLIRETPCFDSAGLMMDASRNAVPTVASLQEAMITMALMGLNQLMLYTEDTYEVEGYPYFGYMRGRYTQQELRQIDDWAFTLGIEVVPCIQTLAHLTEALKWHYAAGMRDTSDILLAGQEETYAFIGSMIRAASAPFRSRRIHIGMDEAHQLGLGQYLKDHGYRNRFELMNEHLRRVVGIAESFGLSPMIWSDMYFRLGSRSGDYYDPDAVIPKEVIESIPEGIGLVYWDYYHKEQSFYETFIRKHLELGRPVTFAGGIWTWNGIAPNTGKMRSVTGPALLACKKLGVSEVVATMWGDNGAETPWMSAWYGLQLYAEHAYAKQVDERRLEERFRFCVQGESADFLSLGRFDETPGIEPGNGQESNPSKFLLWQDVLIGLYDANVKGLPLANHYRQLAEDLDHAAERNPAYRSMFEWYGMLADVLISKCDLGNRLKQGYDSGDKPGLMRLEQELLGLIPRIDSLRRLHQKVWFEAFKPFGWEVIDMRYGALMIRLQTAADRLHQYLDGSVASLPELDERRLPFDSEWGYNNGTLGRGVYHRIVSANCLFNPV